jgi:hypothetical protein
MAAPDGQSRRVAARGAPRQAPGGRRLVHGSVGHPSHHSLVRPPWCGPLSLPSHGGRDARLHAEIALRGGYLCVAESAWPSPPPGPRATTHAQPRAGGGLPPAARLGQPVGSDEKVKMFLGKKKKRPTATHATLSQRAGGLLGRTRRRPPLPVATTAASAQQLRRQPPRCVHAHACTGLHREGCRRCWLFPIRDVRGGEARSAAVPNLMPGFWRRAGARARLWRFVVGGVVWWPPTRSFPFCPAPSRPGQASLMPEGQGGPAGGMRGPRARPGSRQTIATWVGAPFATLSLWLGRVYGVHRQRKSWESAQHAPCIPTTTWMWTTGAGDGDVDGRNKKEKKHTQQKEGQAGGRGACSLHLSSRPSAGSGACSKAREKCCTRSEELGRGGGGNGRRVADCHDGRQAVVCKSGRVRRRARAVRVRVCVSRSLCVCTSDMRVYVSLGPRFWLAMRCRGARLCVWGALRLASRLGGLGVCGLLSLLLLSSLPCVC